MELMLESPDQHGQEQRLSNPSHPKRARRLGLSGELSGTVADGGNNFT